MPSQVFICYYKFLQHKVYANSNVSDGSQLNGNHVAKHVVTRACKTEQFTAHPVCMAMMCQWILTIVTLTLFPNTTDPVNEWFVQWLGKQGTGERSVHQISCPVPIAAVFFSLNN